MSDLTLEDLLIFEGLDFKETSGARGQQLNIKECPKCGKDSWKVYANIETSLGNCFSCGKTFNLFRFASWLLESRGGGFASHQVGQFLNDIRRKIGYRPTARKIVPPTVAVIENLALPTSAELPYRDGWNHPYLEGRGVNGHYARQFHLRFSAFGSHSYTNEKGESVRQGFEDRIIIPVYDLEGKLVTFQGRDIGGVSDKRYKFAGGLPGTGRYLYQGHVALARKAPHVVLGEGFMDVIGIQKAIDAGPPDLDGAIALGSWGKHLSISKEGDDQIQAFSRLKRVGLTKVTIMYDPEPEAYEEALKAAEILCKLGLSVWIATLPAGNDPGSADASVIIKAIREAVEFTRMSSLRLKMRNPYATT